MNTNSKSEYRNTKQYQNTKYKIWISVNHRETLRPPEAGLKNDSWGGEVFSPHLYSLPLCTFCFKSKSISPAGSREKLMNGEYGDWIPECPSLP
jgi:hypothetical protein